MSGPFELVQRALARSAGFCWTDPSDPAEDDKILSPLKKHFNPKGFAQPIGSTAGGCKEAAAFSSTLSAWARRSTSVT